ncbi:ATP synthase subunit I [Halothiobacillus sp. DCM-1]|uniref:ATP synthase subunit I n=1 Tax=Halothiobacillus sp. DCM-1 TaxID=3112558 RepID=UPI0032442793
MTPMTEGIARRGRLVLIVQSALTGVLVAGFALVWGSGAALGALGGGLIALVLMGLLRLTMQRAAALAVEAPKDSLNLMYAGAAVRFIVLLILFAVALGWLKLSPAPTVGGFVLVMLAGAVAARGGRDSGRPLSKTDLNLD